MAVLEQNKDSLTIVTEFGYTYKLVKSETGSIQLEESFNESDVKEPIPSKENPEPVSDNDDTDFFSWE